MVKKTAWTRVWYRSTRIKIIVNLPLYKKYGAMNSCSQMLDCIRVLAQAVGKLQARDKGLWIGEGLN